LTLKLPDDLVGKTVEVIAFEIEPTATLSPVSEDADKAKRIKDLEKALSKYRANIADFKFNRDEANDYE
jgi:hypothetical protein